MSNVGPLPYPQATALQAHAQRLQETRISTLLEKDKSRISSYQVKAAGLHLDYSRHLLDNAARNDLLALAQQAALDTARTAIFDGSLVNNTEGRAVMHTLLRSDQAPAGLADEFAEVQHCAQRQAQWVDRVSSGAHQGHSGRRISDVVNLGIGGSDLGPRMVCQALTPFHQESLAVHFCANIDPAELHETLRALDPATTLFIVCSKTLRTEETLQNAEAAKRWLLASGAAEDSIKHHFVAVSTNLAAARAFGIPQDNILPMWDWVGGRYSLWSAIGWSIAFAVGNSNFEALLAGARGMDQHFLHAPLASNMPVLMSLLEVWYVNFHGARNHAIIPYDHYLRRLPAFAQQLSMESNGKQVNAQGEHLDYATAPVLWGDEGTNGQHSFHQLLHQGSLLCPVDFILPLRSQRPDGDRHARLVANCIAQGQALMLGRDLASSQASLIARGVREDEAQRLAPHLVIPGNRPSSTISCVELTPESLGALLALYEHKTFCSGRLWQINSFDQWGVELGKALSAEIFTAMNDGDERFDGSTQALLEAWSAAGAG
jgi:glucose-6-phosphate isomerase